MSGREAILGRIRASLAAGNDEARRKAVADRLGEAPQGVIPARGQISGSARTDLFCALAEKVQASVARVAGEADVPAAIADYLRSQNRAGEFRVGGDRRLAALPWDAAPSLTPKEGVSDGNDEVAIAYAAAGVAETGTLVLESGPDNPTSNNFLPDTHIVVIDARDIEGDYENVWARMRAKFGKGALPRTVNFVTGPSRSADIQQTLLLGAHGPRSLHIVVVES